MTYDTSTLHITKETTHDALDDSTQILHQEMGLMSKVIRAHHWIDVSKSQGAAEGPSQSKSVKETTTWWVKHLMSKRNIWIT